MPSGNGVLRGSAGRKDPGYEPVRAVLDRLANVRPDGANQGSSYANCPACEDRKGRLHVARGDDGRALLVCHRRNCDTKDIAGALGLEMSDLFPADDRPACRDPKERQTERRPGPSVKDRLGEFAKALTRERLADLADGLGLPVEAVRALPGPLGFSQRPLHKDAEGPCWLMPEVDGAGIPVGASCRYVSGKKLSLPGGERGIYLAAGWQDRTGPIFLPEGASDTAALTALGLAAVGRPSCTGGVERLACLLGTLEAGRDIVVLGEMDSKPDGSWPGRDGAEKTARQLAEKMGRPVKWALPPGGAKDARAWLQAQSLDLTRPDDLRRAGERLAAGLLENARVAGAKDNRPRFTFLTSAELARRPRDFRYLIRRVLVERQPVVWGGAFKTLKTSLMIDAALSLGSGTPFLGEFDVPERVPVLVVSGESGEGTIADMAGRVCQARGIRLDDCSVEWCFDLPLLGERAHVEALLDRVRDTGAKVLFYDPLYLGLLDPSDAKAASNLFSMGPKLTGVTRGALALGCTPTLVHHFVTNRGDACKVPELSDLAFAGVKEFARAWVLTGRRERYEDGSGEHRLWLVVGGSAGHSGMWAVDVQEGVRGDDGSGRRWEVDVRTGARERDDRRNARDQEKADARLRRWGEQEDQVLRALDQLDHDGAGAGKEQVRQVSAIHRDAFGEAVARLIARGVIRAVPVMREVGKGAQRRVDGISRVRDEEAL